MRIKVLLIEDDVRLADAIIQYLAIKNVDCDYLGSPSLTNELLDDHQYHVIITDINMPNTSGLELCRQLRAKGNTTPILMISSLDKLDDKLAGFNSGTDDYLTKPFDLAELYVRINALSMRKSVQASRLQLEGLGLELDISGRKVYRSGQLIKVTPKGWLIIENLAKAYPEPVSKAQLTYAIWGDNAPDTQALKVHIHHLRQVLDKPFDRPLLNVINGYGVVLQ